MKKIITLLSCMFGLMLSPNNFAQTTNIENPTTPVVAKGPVAVTAIMTQRVFATPEATNYSKINLTVYGNAPTAGWSSPELSIVRKTDTELVYQLLATPPLGVVAQVVSKITSPVVTVDIEKLKRVTLVAPNGTFVAWSLEPILPPLFSTLVPVPAGTVKEIDLSKSIPAGSELRGNIIFSINGAKPEWVSITNTTLRIAPPKTVLPTLAPITINLGIKDSATPPALRVARVDVAVLKPIVPEGLLFTTPVTLLPGTVKEIDLKTFVQPNIGLTGNLTFTINGTKPAWITLNGSVLRIAPPKATTSSATQLVNLDLIVKDSAVPAIIRPAKVSVGVLANPVISNSTK